MLKSLSIWNFALIKFVKIDFHKSLNILTGETGAGKSIMMEALGMAIGNRGNMDTLRHGSDFLRVEAVFELDHHDTSFKNYLRENNIVLEDNTLIIVRQINAQGRNSIQVNDCNVTLAKLKQIGSYLVDIHSQHSNQLLLKESYQLQLLDTFNKELTAPLVADYVNAYDKWKALLNELENYKLNTQEIAQRLDLLNWQIKEIKSANLTKGEDEQLEIEIKKLANSEKIANSINESNSLFQDGSHGNLGITSALDKLRKNLANLAKYGEDFENMANMVEESYYQLKEVESFVNEQQFSVEYSPERLDELQYRLNDIDKLKLKYGSTIESILDYLADIEKEKEKIDNFDDNLAEINKSIELQRKELELKAHILHKARVEQGKAIAKKVVEELYTLGMEDPRFEFLVESKNEYTKTGGDLVNIMFSANPGDTSKPLQKVASGGELSRIALALKTVMAGKDDVDLLVFDEVDTGVGGKTALKIAEKIAKIAACRQVICITHLPQIAAMADCHFYISKLIKDGQTYTEINPLPNDEILKEISRMMSGTEITTISLENAKQLVDNAYNFKLTLHKEE